VRFDAKESLVVFEGELALVQSESVPCLEYLPILGIVADHATELVISLHDNTVHPCILRINVYDRVAFAALDVKWQLRVSPVRHDDVDTAPIAWFVHKANDWIVEG